MAFPTPVKKKVAPPSSNVGTEENPLSAFSAKKKSKPKTDNKLTSALAGLKAAK